MELNVKHLERRPLPIGRSAHEAIIQENIKLHEQIDKDKAVYEIISAVMFTAIFLAAMLAILLLTQ